MLRPQSLTGAWALLEWQVESVGSGRFAWPFGLDADGLLVYAESGWMSATLSQRARSPMPAQSMRQADETARARIPTEYVAYAGRWSLVAGRWSLVARGRDGHPQRHVVAESDADRD